MQFWVIDTFIKHKSDRDNIRLIRDEEDSQTLLRPNEDEEEAIDGHPNEPSDPPPRYSLGDDEDEDDNHSFVSAQQAGNYFQASSSSDIHTNHENEYELKTKK
jgi:hypothetical protein